MADQPIDNPVISQKFPQATGANGKFSLEAYTALQPNQKLGFADVKLPPLAHGNVGGIDYEPSAIRPIENQQAQLQPTKAVLASPNESRTVETLPAKLPELAILDRSLYTIKPVAFNPESTAQVAGRTFTPLPDGRLAISNPDGSVWIRHATPNSGKDSNASYTFDVLLPSSLPDAKPLPGLGWEGVKYDKAHTFTGSVTADGKGNVLVDQTSSVVQRTLIDSQGKIQHEYKNGASDLLERAQKTLTEKYPNGNARIINIDKASSKFDTYEDIVAHHLVHPARITQKGSPDSKIKDHISPMNEIPSKKMAGEKPMALPAMKIESRHERAVEHNQREIEKYAKEAAQWDNRLRTGSKIEAKLFDNYYEHLHKDEQLVFAKAMFSEESKWENQNPALRFMALQIRLNSADGGTLQSVYLGDRLVYPLTGHERINLFNRLKI